jgi:hypothetical protein
MSLLAADAQTHKEGKKTHAKHTKHTDSKGIHTTNTNAYKL